MIKECRSNAGQAIIEFAFVLPLLAIMMVGIIEFGVIFYDQAVIANASREGARAGIVYQKDTTTTPATCPRVADSTIDTVVNNYMSSRLINFGGVGATTSVSISPTTPSADCTVIGETVTVTVTYVHTYLALPSFLGWGSTITLKADTTMRRE
jgi:Flp pilus assembly protein TadG